MTSKKSRAPGCGADPNHTAASGRSIRKPPDLHTHEPAGPDVVGDREGAERAGSGAPP